MPKRSASSINAENPEAKQPSADNDDDDGQEVTPRSVYEAVCARAEVAAKPPPVGANLRRFKVNSDDWEDLLGNIETLYENDFTGPWGWSLLRANGERGEQFVYSSFWISGTLCSDKWVDPECEDMPVQIYHHVQVIPDL